jgi:hypothetical protein
VAALQFDGLNADEVEADPADGTSGQEVYILA